MYLLGGRDKNEEIDSKCYYFQKYQKIYERTPMI